MDGWIKIHRKMIEWEWFTDVNVAHLFVYCILAANHEDRSWRGISVQRGAFITSLDSLAESTGLTIMQVRTALSKLEKTGEVTQNITNKYRIVTISKYEDYQLVEMLEQQSNNKQITNKQQTNNNQITTNKNIKKERKKENNISLTTDTHACTCEGGDGIDGRDAVLLKVDVLYNEHRQNLSEGTETANSFIRFYKNTYGYELSYEDLISWLDRFQDSLHMQGKTHATMGDYRRHFSSWLQKQITTKITQDGRSNTTTRAGQRSSTRDISKPTEGNEFTL